MAHSLPAEFHTSTPGRLGYPIPCTRNEDILDITCHALPHFTNSETEPSMGTSLYWAEQVCHGNGVICACLAPWLSWGVVGERTDGPVHATTVLF